MKQRAWETNFYINNKLTIQQSTAGGPSILNYWLLYNIKAYTVGYSGIQLDPIVTLRSSVKSEMAVLLLIAICCIVGKQLSISLIVSHNIILYTVSLVLYSIWPPGNNQTWLSIVD